jgi:type I restriction enzyme R subunit
VAADKAYRNAQKNNDRQNARIEHDKALVRVMYGVMKDDTELFKQFSDDPMFRRRLAELVFEQTYEQLERERAGAA